MDKSIVVLEENCVWSNSAAAAASKSSGSFVQINSIAVDLSIPVEEIEIPAHEHFSIRGYVAEMRKKDRKLCFPFASEVGNGVLEENLAPLYVPKFRWWQCLNCTAENNTQESIPVHRKNAGRSGYVKGREKDRSSSHKENVTNTEVRDRTMLANMQGAGDFGDEENKSPINNIPNFNPCPTKEIAGGSKNGAEYSEKECSHPSVYVTEANPLLIREKDTNATDFVDHRESDAPKPNNGKIDDENTCPQVKIQSNTVTSGKVRITGVPSPEIGEHDNISSGSDNNSSGLPRRRKPKLRYLADILEAEKSGPSRITSASSSGMQVASVERGAVLAPRDAVDVPENVQKRKLPLEEDRIPEISGSKSEGEDSTKLDYQLKTKTQWIKTRKRKVLDSSVTKRHIHTDDRTVLAREVPKINAADSVDLQKDDVIEHTGVSKSADTPSTMERTRKNIRSSQSGQQMERNSGLSKNKRPEVEIDQNAFMLPPRNRILEEGNMSENVALSLSVNNFMDVERTSSEQTSLKQQTGRRKMLPLDLNETFTPKTGEELPSMLESGSLPLYNNLDDSSAHIKKKSREGQGLGVSGPQNDQQTGERRELGPTDDIPMEIVELMAKNQHERALGDSRKLVPNAGTSRTTRGYPTLHGSRDPIMMNFQLRNMAESNVNPGSDTIRAHQNNHSHFAWLSRNQFQSGKLVQGSFLNPFLQNQQSQTPFTSSGSNMWSSCKDNVPVHVAIPKTCSTQANNTRTHSFVDLQHQGKTISDIKGHEEKQAMHDVSLLKQGRIRPSPKSVGSLDPYSNETIPAMQLLSLMNQGVISSSPFNVGPENFRYKDFSPCTHHPRLNGDENWSTRSRSFSSQHHPLKELPVFPSGQISSRESSGVGPSGSKMPPQQSYRNVIPSTPIVRTEQPVCTLNRNPADFSIPDARNQYTICSRDLKIAKRNALKEKSSTGNVEGYKRQRVTKSARKESARK